MCKKRKAVINVNHTRAFLARYCRKGQHSRESVFLCGRVVSASVINFVLMQDVTSSQWYGIMIIINISLLCDIAVTAVIRFLATINCF